MLKQQNRITALYCRLSREDEYGGGANSESSSIQTQKAMLSQYANENGLSNTVFYVDDGASGATFERENFQRMIGDIENGKVGCVITKDLSRLGRNYLEAGRYRELFSEYGVRYLAMSDGYDSFTDDGGDISTPIKEIIHEFYARDCSRKVKAALKTKAQNGGIIIGVPPYGYEKVEGTTNRLAPDEVTAPNVKRMFRMALEGKTCAQIALIFKKEQILKPYSHQKEKAKARGKEYGWHLEFPHDWLHCTVRGILTNPVYTGNLVIMKKGRKSFKNGKKIDKPKEEWIVTPNTHEPLVSQEDFDTVQERVKSKQRAYPPNEQNIFRGMIFCSDCNSSLTFTHRGGGKRKIAFRCSRNVRHGKTVCTSHNILLDTLKELILHDIQRHASLAVANSKKYAEHLVRISESEVNGKKASLQKEADKCERRLREIETLFQKIYEDKVFEVITQEQFKSLSANLETEQKTLKSRLTELTDYFNSSVEKSRNADSFAELIQKYTDITELNSELVHTLIEKIVVNENEMIDGVITKQIDIYYRFIGCANGVTVRDSCRKLSRSA